MRRENRRKRVQDKTAMDKIILYVGIGVSILAIIVFALLMYSKDLKDDVKSGTMTLEEMANKASNTQNMQNTQSASTDIGKSVKDSKNELNTSNQTNTTNVTNTVNTKDNDKTNSVNSTNNTSKQITTKTNANTNTNKENDNTKATTTTKAVVSNEEKETKKELSFVKPVDGDIMREFAKDNLIYSETLKEWTTHSGVDIKADKTSVVKASEAGTVKSIKNDPRYGLTVVIEHDNNFQTIYSNLLTSEFVVEGEKIEKGQSIGTVGNTAVFEIADDAHLHFEILKDSLPVDPNSYIK